jgi:hypothetical protein
MFYKKRKYASLRGVFTARMPRPRRPAFSFPRRQWWSVKQFPTEIQKVANVPGAAAGKAVDNLA